MRRWALFAICVCSFGLGGKAMAQDTPTPTPITVVVTVIVVPATATSTDTPLPPSATPLPSATPTASSTPTITPTPTATPQRVQIVSVSNDAGGTAEARIVYSVSAGEFMIVTVLFAIFVTLTIQWVLKLLKRE
jgi:hypothetical protein